VKVSVAILAFIMGLVATSAPGATKRGLGEMDGDLGVDFACEVSNRLAVPADAQDDYARRLAQALEQAGVKDLAPQHVLLVDRSPNVQAALLFRLTPGGDWILAGAVPVSTGLPGQFEHFETPLGVFAHSPDNPDFRAEGTFNDNGIRGYGRSGERVFDFGWVTEAQGWGDRHEGTMRLQLHATDPDQLEGWLGSRRSKGCIRVPAGFDEFLDRRGVLDQDYEAAASEGRAPRILLPNRETTRWPGRYLVVIDSGATKRPGWSPAPTGRAAKVPRPADCPPP